MVVIEQEFLTFYHADKLIYIDNDIESILDKKYPHATFHDAILYDLRIDYKNRVVQCEIGMQIGNPEADVAERSKYALGRLTFSKFAFLMVEPPDPNYNYNKPNGVWLDEGLIEEAPLKEHKDFILTFISVRLTIKQIQLLMSNSNLFFVIVWAKHLSYKLFFKYRQTENL